MATVQWDAEGAIKVNFVYEQSQVSTLHELRAALQEAGSRISMSYRPPSELLPCSNQNGTSDSHTPPREHQR